MAVREKEGKDSAGADLHTRWWVDHGTPRERAARRVEREATTADSFFRAAAGYNQEVARTLLTDLNLKLLEEGSPPPGGWGYLRLTSERFSQEAFEQIKRAVQVPPGARALAVDSGVSLRVILTGTPPGERLLELRFSEESSFDAWLRGEWVGEAVFKQMREALSAAPAFVARHLGGQTEP